jgi:dephospho-CoA kinase
MAIRVAFVGKSKAGKTWAADFLRRQRGFKKLSLNDGLRQILRKLYYYETHKTINWQTRVLYYDALYKIDPDIWVGYMERRLRTTTRDVVIDDVRYLNEVARLKELGFVIIRIVAPENKRTRRLNAYRSATSGLVDMHDLYARDFNETAGVDFSIYNDSKDATRASLDDIIADLRKLDSGVIDSA